MNTALDTQYVDAYVTYAVQRKRLLEGSMSQCCVRLPMGVVLFVVGTGGNFELSKCEDWSNSVASRTHSVSSTIESRSNRRELDARTALEHLSNMKDVLMLSITDMSYVLGVSRQAVYKWLSTDTSPDAKNSDAIVKVSKIADLFRESGIDRAGSLLKMKLFDGLSLIDLIKNGAVSKSNVESLINESLKMEKAYTDSAVFNSTTVKHTDWNLEISLPSLKER